MKISHLWTVLISFFVVSPASWASHKVGNGGGGVSCVRNDGSLRVSLLDFWEIPLSFSEPRQLKQSQLPAADQAREALKQLPRTAFFTELRHQLDLLLSGQNVVMLDKDTAIMPPSDAKNLFIQRGCNLVGLAVFEDATNTLFIDSFLFGLLSETDKAGLFVHESVYKILRKNFPEATTDSILARRITACAFTNLPCPDLDPLFGLPSEGPLFYCWAKGAREATPLPEETWSRLNQKFWAYPSAPEEPAGYHFQIAELSDLRSPPVPLRFLLASAHLDLTKSLGSIQLLKTETPRRPYGVAVARTLFRAPVLDFSVPFFIKLDSIQDPVLRIDGSRIACERFR
jgi:hypothetical protein